jgi:hypothetical protein
MDVDKLIAAAKEIDRLAKLQEERSKQLQVLAGLARNARTEQELQDIQHKSRNMGVVVTDYGDAIGALRRALKARPPKPKSTGNVYLDAAARVLDYHKTVRYDANGERIPPKRKTR